MKFSIDKHYLIDPLKKVASALPSKAIIPILSGILFTVDENGLTMTAGNGHVFIKSVIGMDDFEANKPGAVVLDGKKVLEIVQKSGSDITFDAKGLEMTIKSGSNKFKLTGIEAEDFPDIPVVDGESVNLTGEAFKKLVRKTVFATAGEKSGSPILTGVHFQFTDGKVQATATDRNRMARTYLESETTSQLSTVVSRESLNTFIKIAPDDGINFTFGAYGFLAEMKGLVYYSRVLEGEFPDLERVIKISHKLMAQVTTRSMISALENVDIIASSDSVHKAKVTISDDMMIESNTEGGDAAVSVDLLQVEGNGITTVFNIEFALDALKALDSQEAVLRFGERINPFTIQGTEDSNDLYIILPYRTRE